MPGHIPILDVATLLRLRDLVDRLQASKSTSLPLQGLVDIANDVKLNAGVTVDFQATEQLGAPMIVVRMPEQEQANTVLQQLSPREREVAALIAQGQPNKIIARRLGLTLGTVKDHVHRILQKSGLPNRAAVAAAYRGTV